MATIGEIIALSRARQRAVDTLSVHSVGADGRCGGCHAESCPAAATASRVMAWCERRMREIDDGLTLRAGVPARAPAMAFSF